MNCVFNMSYSSMAVWAAKGNPGCMTFLAELYKLDYRLLNTVLYTMSKYPELRGSNGYMIWNDACERDCRAACDVFGEILCNRLPIKTVRAHLAEGRCAPFKPEEYVGGTKV